MLLADVTWPDLVDRSATLVVPVGSTEQHGPHLPLGTDTSIATAVGTALHDADPALVLAPALAYGAAGEHEGFPGTVSIGQDALRAVLVEYGRSACRWATRLVFLNGHGGNLGPLRSAVTLLRHEGRDAGWAACVAQVPGVPADAHAGRYETSLLSHLDPGRVRLDRAEAGDTRPLHEVIGELSAGGTAAVSPNGVLGDPDGAGAAEGRELFAAILRSVSDAIAAWQPDGRTGRLVAGSAGSDTAPGR